MAARTMSLILAAVLALPATLDAAVRRPARPAVRAHAAAAPVAAPLADTPEIAALRAAYRFAVPVYAMMRQRRLDLGGDAARQVNRLYVRPTLADAATPGTTLPDADTVQAAAWLDLAAGPVTLDVPAVPGRFSSIVLIDLFGGAVTLDGRAGRIVLAGPGWSGTAPPGTRLVRAATNDAWLVARVVVVGPADRAAAAGLIRSFTLEVPVDRSAPVATTAVPTAVPDAATLLAVVGEALGRSGATPGRAVPELGLAEHGVEPVAPATMALWRTSLPALRAELSNAAAADGWAAYAGGTASAELALANIGELSSGAALALTAAADGDGAPLSGARAYTVHLPAKLPQPWSLTLVRRAGDGRRVLVDAPAGRHAVGDRTPELRAERDGSFDIFVQAAPPNGERVVNWLPAPPGRFELVFRAYRPPAGDGVLHLPAVDATDVVP